MPTSSFTGVHAGCERSERLVALLVRFSGSIADAGDWHAGTQQSILEPLGFAGMVLPIAQSAMLRGDAAAALAVTGVNAKPSAQKIEINRRITCVDINAVVGESIFVSAVTSPLPLSSAACRV